MYSDFIIVLPHLYSPHELFRYPKPSSTKPRHHARQLNVIEYPTGFLSVNKTSKIELQTVVFDIRVFLKLKK